VRYYAQKDTVAPVNAMVVAAVGKRRKIADLYA
jgi:hypothetical protein